MNEKPAASPSFFKRAWAFIVEHRMQVLALVFSITLTTLVIIFRDEIVKLQAWGLAGIFLINVLGNATVLFPIPSLAVNFAGGSVFNPFLVGLVAGVAEPIGELSGYLAGYGGSAAFEKRLKFNQVKEWMRKRGFLTVFVLSAIPNPLFDMAGMAAGALHFPIWKFLIACWLGKTLKATILALLGAGFFGIVSGWFS
jgi:uncharacterized membrane protein YdjX (TVP38/TMEM64 family)